jgi:hypothetical protein
MSQTSDYKSENCNIDFDTFKVVLVQVLLQRFDGDILFELLLENVTSTMIEQMQGMDWKYDGHPSKSVLGWTMSHLDFLGPIEL